MKRWLVVVAGFSAGCSAAAADHERLGDQAYREGEFAIGNVRSFSKNVVAEAPVTALAIVDCTCWIGIP